MSLLSQQQVHGVLDSIWVLTVAVTFSVRTMTRKMCVHMSSNTCMRYSKIHWSHEFLRLQQGESFTPGTREHVRRREWLALAKFEFILVIWMNNHWVDSSVSVSCWLSSSLKLSQRVRGVEKENQDPLTPWVGIHGQTDWMVKATEVLDSVSPWGREGDVNFKAPKT